MPFSHLTLHFGIKFFLLLILVAKGVYFQKLLDDMLSSLSNLSRELWSFVGNDGHHGRHLEFLKLLKDDDMPSSSF